MSSQARKEKRRKKIIFHKRFRVFLIIISLIIIIVALVCAAKSGAFKPTAKVTFSNNNITIYQNDTQKLKMKYDPKDGKIPSLKYSTSNKKIVTIDKNANIKGINAGTTKVKCSTSKGTTSTCTVTVKKRVQSKTIFLTYDDGPSGNVTPKLLDVLKKYHVRATFFLVGYEAKTYPNIVKREAKEGHTIGIHTYSHNYKRVYASKKAFFRDFTKTEKLIIKLTGKKPRFCRMPGDSNNSFVTRRFARSLIREMNRRGYMCTDWNAATYDAMGKTYSVSYMTKCAIRDIKRNKTSIVLSHDSETKKTTPATTEKIIKYFKKRGYSFEGLDEYQGKAILFI